METLSDRLKSERKSRKWSQAYLAVKAGVGETTINELENNPVRGTKKIIQIARALRVNPEWLATGRGPKSPVIDVASAYVVATSIEDLAEQMQGKGAAEVGRLVELILQKNNENPGM